MGLFKLGKGRFSALALTMGVCLAASGNSAAQPADPFPPVQTLPSMQPPPPGQAATPPQKAPPPAQDWRTLRRVDLPAQLVRATWSETSYLSQGHPVRFGRLSVTMQMSGVINNTVVRMSKNAADGRLIENLSCYNTVNGERKCTLLLNPPDQCYLLVYADSGTAATEKSGTASTEKPAVLRDESFDVLCPETLTLGR